MMKSTDTSPPAKSRGAKQTQQTLSQVASAWFEHHKDSFNDSLRRLLATPLQSLLTWLVVAISLALPATLFLVLENVQQLGQGWRGNTQISVFLEPKARDGAVQKVRARVAEYDDVENIELVSPKAALAEFERHSGLGDVLDSLDDNPLPTVLIVTPKASIDTPEKLTQLREQLIAEPVVEHVQLDMGWLRRLYEILVLAERLVMALAGLLALGVLLVVGNTIRLAIENRRDEIVVVKLVGGTDGFVRRPFLYTGWWYGVGGGVLAMLLLAIGTLWLSGPVSTLATLYRSEYQLTGLDLQLAFIIIAGAGVLGWLGAWLAVSRHLSHIQPR